MLLFLFLGLVSGLELSSKAGPLGITITSGGAYSIQIGSTTWLNSGPTIFRGDGKTFSTEDGSLKINSQGTNTGVDTIGAYAMTYWNWVSSSSALTTSIRVYNDVNVIMFEATFPDAVTNTSSGDANGILSSFPTFKFEGASGVYGYATHTMWGSAHIGNWDNASNPPGGGSNGVPVAIWDRNMSNTIILSPFSNFMSVSQAKWSTQANSSVMGFGVVGTMTSIPKGYSYKTILYSDSTYNRAMFNWGNLLLSYYGKGSEARKADFTNNYLSYWTDNGACYYYFPGESGSYETTLINVYQKAVAAGIPYRSLQLDSWWYYKGTGNGVKNWTTMTTPDMFPRGIQYVTNATGWPITGHNRYWSSNTDYATQNGGKYKFIIELSTDGGNDLGLPTDPSFWDFLLSSSKEEWGLLVYEQDWLSTVWDNLHAIKQDVNVGRNWLIDMGASAQRYNLNIQYCMAYPRHFLQSVEIPAVTQIRVSGDYHQSNSQWQIGDSTILAHALGLAAFKDDFRSTDVAQACANKDVEQWPVLETVVATLSAGPVGPSDHIDNMDVNLLLKTCTVDGRLLKPTYPARSIDATFQYRAFSADGPNGFVWDAISVLSGNVFHHIFVAELASNYNLSPNQLISQNGATLPASIVWSFNASGNVTAFDSTHSLTLRSCAKADFQLYHTAPLWSNGWALLGETSKFVPVSDQRFLSLDIQSTGINAILRGVPGEVVGVSAAQQSSGTFKVNTYSCTLPASGEATLQIPSGQCL